MEIYNETYCTIQMLNNNTMISQIWHSATEDMTSEEFRNVQLQLRKFLDQYKPSVFFTDAVNFRFVINISDQEWNAANLLSFYSEIGGKKIAILLNSHVLTQLSIEQALEEPTNIGFKTKYFDNEQKAKEWLLE